MKNTCNNTWTHKGWTIYKAGPFPGFPKKYLVHRPNAPHDERFVEPTLERAVALINGLLRLDAFNARLKWEAEWLEIEEESPFQAVANSVSAEPLLERKDVRP